MLKDSEPKIALFIDYDNIAIGLKDAGSQLFDVNRVMRRLLDKGRIIFKRAYADWSLFNTHKQPLHESGIEMIDIPMRRSIGKNSADIRLVVDALDLCYTKEHIDTFVIGSGDSDFSPLVSKLKENDKHVIGFGLRGSTSHLLADNCDEFIFYEDLVDLPTVRPPLPPGLTRRQQEAFTQLLDSIGSLMRENKDVLWGSLVKDAIRRKHPSYNEQRYGYNSFSNLLEDAADYGLIGLVRDPKSGGTPVITGFGPYNGEGAQGTEGNAAPSAGRGPSLQVHRDAALYTAPLGNVPDSRPPARIGKAGSTPIRKERLYAPVKPAAKRASTTSAKKAEDEARTQRMPEKVASKTDDAKQDDKADSKKETAEKKPAAKKTTAKSTTRKTAAKSTTTKSASTRKTPAKKADKPEETEAGKTTTRKKVAAKKDDEKPKRESSVDRKEKAVKPARKTTRKKAVPAKKDELKEEKKDTPKAESDDKKTDSSKEVPAAPEPKKESRESKPALDRSDAIPQAPTGLVVTPEKAKPAAPDKKEEAPPRPTEIKTDGETSPAKDTAKPENKQEPKPEDKSASSQGNLQLDEEKAGESKPDTEANTDESGKSASQPEPPKPQGKPLRPIRRVRKR